jgi:hypothetical protein
MEDQKSEGVIAAGLDGKSQSFSPILRLACSVVARFPVPIDSIYF